jgi:hypothetical protein
MKNIKSAVAIEVAFARPETRSDVWFSPTCVHHTPWCDVNGNAIRLLSVRELRAAMGFTSNGAR